MSLTLKEESGTFDRLTKKESLILRKRKAIEILFGNIFT